ncbi:LysR substrate-binding domain-containing protein [Pseudonocardia yuanmonensis]|uniref:LysR substrate-binding domain-containing protein n=1 Tax=Pseudonocardia yuanmonensis TaxID=1095914 RepID=A0ABP8XQS1_9PSEU
MELRQFEYFLAVVREGGFSRAARTLHVGQPALSKQVRNLERELRVDLLFRGPDGVVPTPAGRRLEGILSDIFVHVSGIKDAVREAAAGGISGTVSVGISPTLMPALAAPLSAELEKRHPALSVRIVEALPMFLNEWLESYRLDVGLFTRWPAPGTDPVPKLTYRRIGVERVVLTAAGAAATRSRWNGVPDYARCAGILQELPLVTTPGFLLLLEERRDLTEMLSPLTSEIDSVHTVRDMVLRGEVCSVLPVTYIREDLAAGRLIAASFAPPLRRELVGVTPTGRTPSGAVQVVIETARARLTELASADDAGAGTG